MLTRTLLLAITASMCVPHSSAQTIRVPAEWEEHDSTWMQWPVGIESSYRSNFANIIGVLQAYEPIDMLVPNASQRSQAQDYLTARGIPLANITWHLVQYEWAWMRDNGPVWVDVDGALVLQDWAFDAWGGIVPTWDLDDAIPCQVAALESVICQDYSNVINERGTLEFNGVDTVIVSWPVLSDRNPGWTQGELETLFEQAWGVTDVIWLLTAPASDYFTGGHVDGIARFIDADTVVVSRYVDQNDPDAPAYEEAAQIIADAGFEVLRLDIPGNVNYFGPMAANYVNWLVANDVVVVPGFDDGPWDAAAKNTIEGFFPGRDVYVVETLEIWYWGGGVHCVTNDQPKLATPSCARDVNDDGTVDVSDLLMILSAWGACPGCPEDVDGDDVVGIGDLLAVLAVWGDC